MSLPNWKLILAREDAEEWAHFLAEYGALGFEFLTSDTFNCYFSGTAAELCEFSQRAAAEGFKVNSTEECANINWVQRCSEVLQPISIKSLRIITIQSKEDKPSDMNSPRDIYIIPGSGFGTGHHESTRLALELLQAEALAQNPPVQVLDVGTGSGVLALAAHALYNSDAIAVDTDSFALENAQINSELNVCSGSLKLMHGSINITRGIFDLILANIYVEVLCEMQPDFYERLRRYGFLILSGIKSESLPLIDRAFSRSHWRFHMTRQENSWAALLLERL